LSVFDGESLSTDAEGKLSARIGGSVITLVGQSGASLQRSGDGTHIDLDEGAIYIWSAEGNPLEVHAEGALLRLHAGHQGQVQVLLFAPKVLQITTRQGSVDFWYGKEFRVLPEGQTYRIYLESEDGPGLLRLREAERGKRACPPARRWRISFWQEWVRGLRRGGFTI